MGDKGNIYRDITQIDQVSSPGKSSEQSNQLSVCWVQLASNICQISSQYNSNQSISVNITGNNIGLVH